MNRTIGRILAAFTAALLLLPRLAALHAADAPAAPPRNILFIITDQQTVGASVAPAIHT